MLENSKQADKTNRLRATRNDKNQTRSPKAWSTKSSQLRNDHFHRRRALYGAQLFQKFPFPSLRKLGQAHKLEIKTLKFCQKIAKPIVYCKFSVVTCRITMMNWVTAVTPPKPVHQWLVFQSFSSPTGPRPNFEDERGECCYSFCLHLWDHGVAYGYITVNATIAWCSIQVKWLCSGFGSQIQQKGRTIICVGLDFGDGGILLDLRFADIS